MSVTLKLSITSALLFYTVEALQCYSCASKECNETTLMTCSAEDICSTSTIWATVGSKVSKECSMRGENCVFMNKTTIMSVRTGYSHISYISYCCSMDGCNQNTLSVPSEPNALKCYTCMSEEDKVCNTPLKCVGVEDQCFRGPSDEGHNDDQNVIRRGCASTDLCRSNTHHLSTNIYCCKGSLCNHAWGMTLSLLSFLLALLIKSLV
ncbi:hypothetical protein UPYG_G00136230 [Umbra pygmaea]|uniref:UPAR/Ly6 domain-containing protein n=1 Tax=Umbra pygmaea TaxID=75934 RepID=A0ABD0XCN8_UMBPY